MDRKQLADILEKHMKWTSGEEGDERADLRNADLYGADLHGADLRGADLNGADLRYADLNGAELNGAVLYGSDLRCAKLNDAVLRGADLHGTDLRCAKLNDADLRDAVLRGAKLNGADLRYADLRNADLYGAVLRGANLHGADLYGANLYGARMDEITASRLSILPEGEIIGWKRLRQGIAKLSIPSDARRSNATSRKCRAEFADVLAIYDGDKELQSATSMHDPNFIYEVGKRVTADAWDEDRWNECSNGIHFFITRAEAENY